MISEYQISVIIAIIFGLLAIISLIAFLLASPSRKSGMFGLMLAFFLVAGVAKSYLSRYETCLSCNKHMDTDFCTYCGETINVNYKKICPTCNQEWDTNFCGNCGTQMIIEENSNG